MEQLKIVYEFTFRDKTTKSFDVHLDKDSLSLITETKQDPPEWARLEYKQCSICPLDKALHTYCPIAANLSGIAQEFREANAKDKVDVNVAVKERSYHKTTSVQEGLSPLLGIIMTTSGCPVMDPLRPMVRFHLPFASLDETAYRMATLFLMAQLLRDQAGKKPEWSLEGISDIYAEVNKLNKEFSQRMIAAAKSDANVHALVNLNVFAIMVPKAADKMLKEMAPYFAYYLK